MMDHNSFRWAIVALFLVVAVVSEMPWGKIARFCMRRRDSGRARPATARPLARPHRPPQPAADPSRPAPAGGLAAALMDF